MVWAFELLYNHQPWEQSQQTIFNNQHSKKWKIYNKITVELELLEKEKNEKKYILGWC